LKLGGADINLDQGIVPVNIYVRAISLQFTYEVEVENILPTELIKKIIISSNNHPDIIITP
jgi:hypothetical protein